MPSQFNAVIVRLSGGGGGGAIIRDAPATLGLAEKIMSHGTAADSIETMHEEKLNYAKN